jgi:hypothetical protein
MILHLETSFAYRPAQGARRGRDLRDARGKSGARDPLSSQRGFAFLHPVGTSSVPHPLDSEATSRISQAEKQSHPRLGPPITLSHGRSTSG